MERPVTLIKDITSTTKRPWTAKITVVEKDCTRTARSSSTKFQHLVLADSMNTRVQITLFNEGIEMFKDRLQLFKTYYISNVIVKDAPKNFRFEGGLFQWNLHSSCLIEEAIDSEGALASLVYDFVVVDNLLKYKDSTTPFDMLVVVLQLLPKKTFATRDGASTIQEMIVVDKSLRPVVMTLWDHFVTNEANDLASIIEQKPIIAAFRVSLLGNSCFLINPTIQLAMALRAWVFDNITSVNVLGNSEDLVSMARGFGKHITSEFTTLLSIHDQPYARLFNVKCHLHLLDLKQDMARKFCSYYNKVTTAEIGNTYTCNFCSKSDATCLLGLRVDVIASDLSGKLPVTLYGKNASNLLNCTAEKIMQNKLLADPQPVATLLNCNTTSEINLQIRSYNHTYMGTSTRNFTASFIEDVDEITVAPAPVEVKCNSTTFNIQQTLDEAESMELASEERQLMQNIMDRQKLRKEKLIAPIILNPDETHYVSTLISPLHSGSQTNVHSIASAVCNLGGTHSMCTLESPLEVYGSSKSGNILSSTTSEVPNSSILTLAEPIDNLSDELQWETLMEGPTEISPSNRIYTVIAEQSQENIPIQNKNALKKEAGKERAPIDKKKIQRHCENYSLTRQETFIVYIYIYIYKHPFWVSSQLI